MRVRSQIAKRRPALGPTRLFVFRYAPAAHGQGCALTPAFTTFVPFQLFNAFKARDEHGSAFNASFFGNGKLWQALGCVLLLQVLKVHWGPAQTVFDSVDLRSIDWGWATAVAASVLLLDEARKLMHGLYRDKPPSSTR